jgi:hypothetical protein
MKNIIAFKKGLCILGKEVITDNTSLVSTIQAEIMQYGFMFDQSCFNALCRQSKSFLVDYYSEIMPYIKKTMGASKNYQPFYRNFPEQVMAMSHCELFRNAILHYWSEGTWEPEQELIEKGIKFENIEFRMIKATDETGFMNIFTKLVSMNNSMTPNDKEIVEWFVENYRYSITLPNVIPFKETLCVLAAKGFDVPVKSVTDVLRVATYLSNGDISLPKVPKVTVDEVRRNRLSYFFQNLRDSQLANREAFKFAKFSRPQRKYLLGLLEKTNTSVEEMQSRLGRWLRLGEILHPSEYAKQFPKTAKAFATIRNQKDAKVRTFNSKVNTAFKTHWNEAIELLSTRPGEFARKLDWMLRTTDNYIGITPANVLSAFENIGDKISTKVLFELFNHFDARDTKKERMIMIKGKRSHMQTLDALPPMSKSLIDSVKSTIIKNLKAHFIQMPRLGKVHIDERLKKIPLPFAMRSVNTAVKTYVRGTRIPFSQDAKVVRPFVHWFDEHGNEDIDLSASFHYADLKFAKHLSYTHLKSTTLNSCHSGDIRQRQGACAEYVDIDIDTCLSKGVTYAVIQIHNFQRRPMHSLKDCVVGFMEREYPESNPTFVPKTISNCMTLANESDSVIACIVDLVNREYIWIDIECNGSTLANLENTKGETAKVLKGLINLNKMSVYDLLRLHTEARGSQVMDILEAETKFTYEDFVTDYAKIQSYM